MSLGFPVTEISVKDKINDFHLGFRYSKGWTVDQAIIILYKMLTIILPPNSEISVKDKIMS